MEAVFWWTGIIQHSTSSEVHDFDFFMELCEYVQARYDQFMFVYATCTEFLFLICIYFKQVYFCFINSFFSLQKPW